MQVPAVPLRIQLLANAPRNAAEDGAEFLPPSHVETWMMLLAPGFGLVQFWLLWPSGE